MMVVELRFEAHEPRRVAARPAHRERLVQLYADGELAFAGPWDDDTGALLVFRTDEQGVRRILDSDPYYAMPGVAVASVRRWQPVVGAASL